MLKRLLLISLLILPLASFAQEEGKFGLIKVTDENRAIFEEERAKIPLFRTGIYRAADEGVKLPEFVDNSKLKFFPSVISQISNSCGPASMVHYMYTYEVNKLLDRDAKDKKNVAQYFFPYNFINDGEENGTMPHHIIRALKNYGAASEADFVLSSRIDKYAVTEWMHGFDKYARAAQYTIDTAFQFISDQPGQLEAMKRYIYDGGNGAPHGGCIQFSAWAHPLASVPYDNGSKTGYVDIIPRFGNTGMHSMTIVGYDDSVWWDYDGDKNKDADELGAFICVNTWGTTWGKSKGFFYAPYRTFTIMPQSKEGVDNGGGTGNGGKYCTAFTAKVVAPKAMLKFTVQHSIRCNLSYELRGYDASGKEVLKAKLKPMKNAGGNQPMRAGRTFPKDVLEFGLNISDYINDDIVEYKAIIIDDVIYGKKEGAGSLLSCDLVDFRQNPESPKVIPGFITSSRLLDGMNAEARIMMNVESALPEGIDAKISHHHYGRDLFLCIITKTACDAKVDLCNINGVSIKTLLSGEISAGTTSKAIEIDGAVADGTYFLKTVVNNNVEFKKIEIKTNK